MGEESILDSIKKLIGIQEDDISFDRDIIWAINSVLSVLTQLGVGPKDGFQISGSSEIWSDFMDEDPKMNSVKSYVYMRVKMLFDPPLSASVSSAMLDAINEFEWRLNVQAESSQGVESK
jgi:hypothetical protein